MNTDIFVMSHKTCDIPQDNTYRILQVGCAKNGRIDGYLWDDTGDNISERNPYYSELTGLYWLWRNWDKSDIIGVCHYRRFLLNSMGDKLSGQEIEDILKENDIIVSNREDSGLSTKEVYERCHYIKDLDAVCNIINDSFPDYSEALDRVLSRTKNSAGNLMITKKETMYRYCEWLFPILFEAERVIDISGYDDYHKRVYGFLSEILMNVWIEKENLSTYHCPIGITQEKSETIELKQQLSKLIEEKKYPEAGRYFEEFYVRRPDVSLEDSDLTGELPDIYVLLHIWKNEMGHNITQNMFAEDRSCLSEKIVFYRRIEDILNRLGAGTAVEEDVKYLL